MKKCGRRIQIAGCTLAHSQKPPVLGFLEALYLKKTFFPVLHILPIANFVHGWMSASTYPRSNLMVRTCS